MPDAYSFTMTKTKSSKAKRGRLTINPDPAPDLYMPTSPPRIYPSAGGSQEARHNQCPGGCVAVRNCWAGGGLWGGVSWLCQPDCSGKKPGRGVRVEEMGKRGRGFRKVWLSGEYERAGNRGGTKDTTQVAKVSGKGTWLACSLPFTCLLVPPEGPAPSQGTILSGPLFAVPGPNMPPGLKGP